MSTGRGGSFFLLTHSNFTFTPSLASFTVFVHALPSTVYVHRPWWLFVAMFLLSFLHLAFNANPMHTAASLKIKEAEKAAETAKKGK